MRKQLVFRSDMALSTIGLADFRELTLEAFARDAVYRS